MQTFIFIIFIFIFLAALSIHSYSTPQKRVTEKYGQPLKHYATQKGWNGLPIRGSRIDIDFYSDFIIITEHTKEIILKKDFKDYKIYGSYLNSVFKINNLQICINNRLRNDFEEFFVAN